MINSIAQLELNELNLSVVPTKKERKVEISVNQMNYVQCSPSENEIIEQNSDIKFKQTRIDINNKLFGYTCSFV